MDKRIISWKLNDHEDHNSFSRAFIFGGYGETFSNYSELVAEAKRDYPTLKDQDIIISKVHTSSYMKGYSVISFLVPVDSVKKGYKNWDQFDFNY